MGNGQEILVDYPDDTTICLSCFWADAIGQEWMHGECMGHVFLAWNGREFDCTCPRTDLHPPLDGSE